MGEIRASIEAGRFVDRSAEISEGWARGDIPLHQG
jgi:queuine tRNA-ribosyltransferase